MGVSSGLGNRCLYLLSSLSCSWFCIKCKVGWVPYFSLCVDGLIVREASTEKIVLFHCISFVLLS